MSKFANHRGPARSNAYTPFRRGRYYVLGFLLCLPLMYLQGCATTDGVSDKDQNTLVGQQDQMYAEARKHYLEQEYQEAIVLLKKLARDGDSRAQ